MNTWDNEKRMPRVATREEYDELTPQDYVEHIVYLASENELLASALKRILEKTDNIDHSGIDQKRSAYWLVGWIRAEAEYALMRKERE